MTVYIHVNTYHRCAIIYLFNFIYLCQKNAVVLYLRVFDLLYIYMHELINGYDMENKICFFILPQKCAVSKFLTWNSKTC